MILKNVLMALFVSAATAMSQGLVGVMANSNGVVQRPTNFITANNLATGTADTAASFVYPVNYGGLESYVQGVSTVVNDDNSALEFGVTGSSTNSEALARVYRNVDNMGTGGVGTRWDTPKIFKITWDGIVRSNGSVFRSVIGGNTQTAMSNIASYPTNKAIGFEIETTVGLTNRIRLIAHNGTNSTNGAWHEVGDVFQRQNISIRHTGTNGTAQLWHSINYNQPTNVTAAGISGAPVGNGPIGHSTWEMGFFQPSTNNGNAGITVFKATWEIDQ